MRKKTYTYPCSITKDEDGIFIVEFKDWDNIFTQGSTLREASYNALEALELTIEGHLENDYHIPDESEDMEPVEGGTIHFITATIMMPFSESDLKKVNKTISMPTWMANELKKYDLSLSSFVQKKLAEEFKILGA
jgi:antitoxin HicB